MFYKSIYNKDTFFFNKIKTKSPLLYSELVTDFEKDRVNRKNLIEYFSHIFGSNIYNSNRTLITKLKELSHTDELFQNDKTINNNGKVYYKLNK